MFYPYFIWILPFITLFAVLVIFWGLLKFLLAKGDMMKKKRGKKIMFYSAVALLFSLFIWGILGSYSESMPTPAYSSCEQNNDCIHIITDDALHPGGGWSYQACVNKNFGNKLQMPAVLKEITGKDLCECRQSESRKVCAVSEDKRKASGSDVPYGVMNF